MDEELIRLVFFGVLMLFWVIAGVVKKKALPPKPGTQQRRVEAQQRPAKPTPQRVRVVSKEPVRRPAADHPVMQTNIGRDTTSGPKPKRGLAEELLAMLQEQVEPEPAVAEVREPIAIDDEAQSLETLEPAGRESYDEFHAKYVEGTSRPKPYEIEEEQTERPYAVEAPLLKPYQIAERARVKPGLSRKELRHAFVMREVLGPPKALE